ncbi:MAG: hypothetical protein WCX22_08425 [Methanoregula sp.]
MTPPQQEPTGAGEQTLFDEYLKKYPQDAPYFDGLIHTPISKNVKRFLRSRPLTPADAPTGKSHIYGYDDVKKCLSGYSGALEAHDLAIATAAKAEERKRILKESCKQCPMQDETPDTCENCLIHKVCSSHTTPGKRESESDHDVIANKVYPRPKKQEREP